ncbi:MAG: GIDE domain-containing protein [Chromatiales bacterium]|jgi:hypothetical protein
MVRELTQMAPGAFWSLAVALSALTLFLLYFAFRSLHRARLIEDTPTSRIRSAPQGYVELIGQAALMQGESIFAPLSGMPCCWWRFKIERKHDKGWRVTRSGQSESLFLLRDETGECIIDPDGAHVSPSDKSVWYGSNATPSSGPDRGPGTWQKQTGLFGLNVTFTTTFGDNYRYTEETIIAGDPLYAIGLFKSVGETDRKTMREEQIKERLRQWKADHASLLKRFDRNRDGQIDLDEWELARRSARTQVMREQMRENQQAIHTLSDTGSHRRPLLISTREEFDIVRHFRLWAGASLLGFFLLGAATIWMMTIRLL